MVHFAKDKIILEIPASNPYYEYLELLQAFNTIGWFVAGQGELDASGAKAYSKLSYYIGAALCQMEHDEAMQIDTFLRKEVSLVEVGDQALVEQE